MNGASISQQKQNRLIQSHSVTCSSTPLEQPASAFSAIDQCKISYINFQPAVRDTSGEPQSSSHHQFASHSPDQQAILSNVNQAKDTLLSVVSPQLGRNNQYCHRFSEKSNAKSYWSQQGTLLSLDHGKLLAEATRKSKVSLCSPQPKQQSPSFSRISGTCGWSVSSGPKSGNNKTRLKWTADLHEKFVNCVNLLGGAEKATPRAILKLMKSDGLTVFQVKSHLQKYRYAKCMTDSTQGKPDQGVNDYDLPLHCSECGMQVKEILQMQLEVQRHLYEIQQNLQQAIEEQGKQIQMMLGQLIKENKLGPLI